MQPMAKIECDKLENGDLGFGVALERARYRDGRCEWCLFLYMGYRTYSVCLSWHKATDG